MAPAIEGGISGRVADVDDLGEICAGGGVRMEVSILRTGWGVARGIGPGEGETAFAGGGGASSVDSGSALRSLEGGAGGGVGGVDAGLFSSLAGIGADSSLDGCDGAAACGDAMDASGSVAAVAATPSSTFESSCSPLPAISSISPPG